MPSCRLWSVFCHFKRLQSNSVKTNSSGPAIFVRYNRVILCIKMSNMTLKCVCYNRVFVNNRVRYNRVWLYFQVSQWSYPCLTSQGKNSNFTWINNEFYSYDDLLFQLVCYQISFNAISNMSDPNTFPVWFIFAIALQWRIRVGNM